MLEFSPLRISPAQDSMPKMNGNPATSPPNNTNSSNNNNAALTSMTMTSPLPQALQNLQRLLQSQLANVNPLQLQQALQRQQQIQMADAGRKQLEQMLQQLQEQLQMNLLQQTHLSSGPGKPNASAMQQLQQQQQQLVAQMQMTQQALILGHHQGMEGSPMSSPAQTPRMRERHMSDTYGGSTGSSDGSLKENKPDNNNDRDLHIKTELNGRDRHVQGSPPLAPPSRGARDESGDNDDNFGLYSHGHCHWPGCEASCPDWTSFHRHLSTDHPLSDKATAQTRVQMQIVSQLELQLNKERGRLRAMMKHLRLENKNGELVEVPSNNRPHARSPSPKRMKMGNNNQESNNTTASPPLLPPSFSTAQYHQSPLSALTAAVRSPITTSTSMMTSVTSSIRPKPAASLLMDGKHSAPATPTGLNLPQGFDERRGRGDRGNPNLDPEMDIKLNREFYMNNDVRPPYTYAALIRYAILENPDQQLTLHEIYNWFTTTFMYFRRNAASWKNAVRHNLSLHKCFMRVENVKGAVWTVDDEEYHRRRPPRGVQSAAGSATNSPTLTPQAPSIIDQSLSSMFGAAAAAAAAASTTAAATSLSGQQQQQQQQLPFFSHAALMEQMRRNSNANNPSNTSGNCPIPASAAFPDFKAMMAAAAAAAAAATTSASNSTPASASGGLESPPQSLDNRSTPGSLDLSRLKSEDSPPAMVKPFREDKNEDDGDDNDDDDDIADENNGDGNEDEEGVEDRKVSEESHHDVQDLSTKAGEDHVKSVKTETGADDPVRSDESQQD